MRSHINKAIQSSDKFAKLDKPYIVAVTSCYRGEGVSTVAVGIAYTYSLYERENVLLVDANLHQPEIDRVTGISRPKGLFEMSIKSQLNGFKERENKNALSPGDMTDYLSQLEDPNKINKLLPAIQKLNYKLIVLDLQSISEGVNAVHASSIADGLILVIESERVRREVVSRIKEQLLKVNTHIICTVLNKRKYYIPHWVYEKM
jgi:Mrp family chromosome partitioning ATPase